MFTHDQLRQLSVGYDLDGGGYEFERAPDGLDADDVVVWDDPDLDYLGLQDVVRIGDFSCPVFAFAPGDLDYEFPESYEAEGLGTMVRVATGVLHHTTHECNCHGKLMAWTGAAGEPEKPIDREKAIGWLASGEATVDQGSRDTDKLYFEHTGNPSDPAFPDCDRCGGEGRVPSSGGAWAIYAFNEE